MLHGGIRTKLAALIRGMRAARGALPVLLGIAGASALVAITWQITDSIHQGHIERLSAEHAIQADTTSTVEGINQSVASAASAIRALSPLAHDLRASIGNTSLARLAEVKEINRMHENAFKSLHQYVTANQKYFDDPKTITARLTTDFDQYKMASDAMVVQYKEYFITFSDAIGSLEHTLLMGAETMSRELQVAVSQLEKLRCSRSQVPLGFSKISTGNNARARKREQRIINCISQIDRLDALKEEIEDIKNRQQVAPPDKD